MTMISSEVITCPNCKQQQSIDIYRTVNVTLDSTLREKLFGGDINIFKCGNCQTTANIDIQFLYHDMDLKIAVQFFPPQYMSDPQFLAQFESDGQFKVAEMPFKKKIPGTAYLQQPHLVFSMNELLAYVVFREKLAASLTEDDES